MLEAKPQRHRDTEFAQRYFLNSPQPRRHEGTKKSRSCPATLFNAKTQRRKDAKPTHPPIWPTDHTDKHRWNHDFWLCVARFRPSNGGRVPLGRDTDSNVNVRHGLPTQRPALDERRPRHLSSSFNGWKAHTPHYNNTEERQNRRAFVSSWLRRASWADLCDLWAVLSVPSVPSVPLWFCQCFGDAKALSALE